MSRKTSITKDFIVFLRLALLFVLWILAKLIFMKFLGKRIWTFCRDARKTEIFSAFGFKKNRTWKFWLLLMIISVILLLLICYRRKLNDVFISLHSEKPCFTSTRDLENIRYMIHSFHTIMTEQKLVYWIDCGTLLGALRYKDIIPWDHDGDIAYLLSDLSIVKQSVAPELTKRFSINISESNPVQMKYHGTMVDLFQYATYAELPKVKKPLSQSNLTLTRAKYRLTEFLEIYFDAEKHLVLPTKKCLFAEKYVNCPAKPDALLKYRYPKTLNKHIPYKLQCWLPWNLWKVWTYRELDTA